MTLSRKPVQNLVGMVVYKPYRPNRVGKVMSVVQESDVGHHTVTVKWKKGDITHEDVHGLKDYEELVSEHLRLFERHKRIEMEVRNY